MTSSDFPLDFGDAWVVEVRPLVALYYYSTSLCGTIHLAVLALYANSHSKSQQDWERARVLNSNDCISVLVKSLLKPLFKRLVCKYCISSFL